MYVEQTKSGFNIMDIDIKTLQAINKIINSDNMKTSDIQNEEHDKLIELKFKAIKEIHK